MGKTKRSTKTKRNQGASRDVQLEGGTIGQVFLVFSNFQVLNVWRMCFCLKTGKTSKNTRIPNRNFLHFIRFDGAWNTNWVVEMDLFDEAICCGKVVRVDTSYGDYDAFIIFINFHMRIPFSK